MYQIGRKTIKLYKRRLYILELFKKLATNHMKFRAQNTRLLSPVKQALQSCGIELASTVPMSTAAAAANEILVGVGAIEHGKCYKCETRNQVKSRCNRCNNFTCKTHSRCDTICTNCYNE